MSEETPVPMVSRRTMLRGGAIAAGVVWTKPVASSVRLLATPGSPPPTSSSTSSSSTTSSSTTSSTTSTSIPETDVTFASRGACTTFAGSYDVEFVIDGLPPGRKVVLRLDYVSGELHPGSSKVYGRADDDGHVVLKIDHFFRDPWSALLRLDYKHDPAPEPLVAGNFVTGRRCEAGTFTPA
jgi:hypothetical protein